MDKKELEGLQDIYEQGFKVKVHKSSFSNRFYTVSLALLVVGLFAQIWVPISALMYSAAGIAAIIWMTMYKMQCDLYASLKNMANITKQVDMAIIQHMMKEVKKQGVIDEESKGTSEAE